MATALKRLQKEIKEYQKQNLKDIQLFPNEANMQKIQGIIQGPKDTPYEKGQFELSIVVPSKYPLEPPVVKFVTHVFHPNIYFKTGEICLDILRAESWSPAWSILTVCQAIQALLSSGEPSSPFNCDAGNLLRAGDVIGFQSMAKMYTVEYAIRD